MKNNVLIATRPLVYGTRRLRAGDQFVADQGDGRVYVMLGFATEAPALEVVDSDLEHWRTYYFQLYGRMPDGRWGVDRIKKVIET